MVCETDGTMVATTTPVNDEIPDRLSGRESRRSLLLSPPYTALFESAPIVATSRARVVVRAVENYSEVDMNVDAVRIAVVVAVAALTGIVVIGPAGRRVTGCVTGLVTGGIAGRIGATAVPVTMAVPVPVTVPMTVAVSRSAERVPAVTAVGIAGKAVLVAVVITVLVAVVVAGIVSALVSATAVVRRCGDAVRNYGGRRGAGAERHAAYDNSADNCRSGEQ